MEMMISSRNLELSESIRSAAQEKVGRLARHLDGWDVAEIHFFEERNPRISDKEVCEVTLRGHGHILRAKAAAPDPFVSIDRVVDKLGHQVEKLKTRINRRNHGDASPRARRHGVGSRSAGPEAAEGQVAEGQEGGRIVKVKRFDLKPMTPEEAVLQMDLLGHTFYFFVNAETGQAAVVYRRGDGDYGLIDAT